MFLKYYSPVRYLTPKTYTEIQKRLSSLSFYEPPYIQKKKSVYPLYEALTIQVKGYDFPPLENYQKFVHNVAKYMDISISKCWAHPAKRLQVIRYKPQSSSVEATYNLLSYERNIKLLDVPTTKLSIFLEVIKTGLPEGTIMNVFHFDQEHENDKYVPNHDLNDKIKELETLGGPLADDLAKE